MSLHVKFAEYFIHPKESFTAKHIIKRTTTNELPLNTLWSQNQ